MTDLDTLNALLEKIDTQAPKLERLDRYYRGGQRLAAIGLALPPEMERLQTVINWPALAVDSLEERLDVEGFQLGGDTSADERLWDWWQANDLDEESSLAHLDALVLGRSYVTVSTGEAADDPPVITVESARTMAVNIDPATRRIAAAARVWERDETDQPSGAVLYLPGRNVYWRRLNGRWVVQSDDRFALDEVAVVPLVNRARLAHRHGVTEMRDVMALTDAACRSLTNLQAAQEMLAVPQRYVLGATQTDFQDPDGNPVPVWEAYIGRFLALGNQDARIGQLQGADLRNFTEVINHYARLVASVTGLPPHFLGLSTDNPASADAIRSSEARLVKRAERRARAFGEAWERVMRLALRVVGDDDAAARRMETVWRDPSTPTYAARADAVVKLYQAGLLPQEAAWEQMGWSPEYRRHLRSLSDTDPAVRFLELDQAAPVESSEEVPA
ncbi:phage portal protein [Marinactinospora rubrisoli]|uniref:Phage portal protein n=1 Tax=Marinactinospora rubrisoli TaxID=2715399 RepID=A0ABW2KLB7_9ACTN